MSRFDSHQVIVLIMLGRVLKLASLAVFLLWATPSWASRWYRGGAVATAHPVASHAALEMLDRGGNAADAAVAAAFALAVVAPYHSGLGGGGFALAFDAKSKSTGALDFREVAPAAARADMYVREGQLVPELSTDGALAIAVPGAVAGYFELVFKHGSLPPKVVLGPAIRAARRGFWVTPKYRAIAEERAACLRQNAEASRLFLEGGQAPSIGYRLAQPELARTLELLSSKGPSAFYSGKIAAAIVAAVKREGGILTTEDLSAYRVRWRSPLVGSYRGHAIATMPPPSAGGLAVVQVLAMLEQLGAEGPATRDIEGLHIFIEAMRRAYSDRAKYLGDPAAMTVSLAELTSRGHLAQLASSIDRAHATESRLLFPASPGEPDGGIGKKSTSHISVIDRRGNAVALTTTVNYYFGSCLAVPGTGLLLNDEMDDFAAQPLAPNTYGLVTGEANAIAPRKIPLSSMAPTLVFQKGRPPSVLLVVGSPGGSTIPTTVIQVISNVVDGAMDVARAVGFGRLHHQGLPDRLLVDRFGLEPATSRALETKGHRLERTDGWGDAEAVLVDPVTSLRAAASDPRNEGLALGQD